MLFIADYENNEAIEVARLDGLQLVRHDCLFLSSVKVRRDYVCGRWGVLRFVLRNGLYFPTFENDPLGSSLIGREFDNGHLGRFVLLGGHGLPPFSFSDPSELTEDILFSRFDSILWLNGNNCLEYDFSVPNKLRVSVSGRRYCVPTNALYKFSPSRVLVYETRRPSWSPWECHILREARGLSV